MKYETGQFVDVKLIGYAKIEKIIDGTYFLFFSDGKRGQGWRDHDIKGVVTDKKFWSEWRRNKSYC